MSPKFLLTILVGLFLIFSHQSAIASEYFSEDTKITIADNKTTPMRDIKVLAQVSVIPDLALHEPQPGTDNLKIDQTWQIATFNASGDIITMTKPKQDFMQLGIRSDKIGELFPLPEFPQFSNIKLISLTEVTHFWV